MRTTLGKKCPSCGSNNTKVDQAGMNTYLCLDCKKTFLR